MHFVALRIQHQMRMHHIFLCVFTVQKYFYVISQKISLSKEKKVTEMLMCDLTFHTNFLFRFLCSKTTERDMIKSVNWFSCEVPLFLSDLFNLQCFRQSYEKYSNVNFIQIRPVGGELCHV